MLFPELWPSDRVEQKRGRDTETGSRYKQVPLVVLTLKEFRIQPQREHKESDDKDLPDLNPNVEQKEGHNNTLTKHHDFEVTREREAVNQAK